MQLYGFDFEKYEKIQSNIPTIFAPNCWGGVIFHSMNLKFNSPFINMFELPEDYIKFLKNPKHYLQSDLKFIEMRYEPVFRICQYIFMYGRYFLCCIYKCNFIFCSFFC